MQKILGTTIGVSLFILISWFGIKLYTFTSQPGLKLQDKIFTVVNCEQPRDEQASMACPYLYCNKALLESGEIPENANINRTAKTEASMNNIKGEIRYTTKENVPIRQDFQCKMQGDKVIGYKILAIK